MENQSRKRLVGNFPQAFTHVALQSSAFKLARYEKALERRALGSAEARQPVAAET